MTPRKKRLIWAIGAVMVLSIVTVFVVQALRQNLVFFYSPTEVLQGQVGQQEYFRIGGVVSPGSLERQADGITIAFAIEDGTSTLPVEYQGLLPDLFKEGQGAVAQGHWDGQVFRARQVLAKHDENYMPPEAQYALDQQQTATKLNQAAQTLILEP